MFALIIQVLLVAMCAKAIFVFGTNWARKDKDQGKLLALKKAGYEVFSVNYGDSRQSNDVSYESLGLHFDVNFKTARGLIPSPARGIECPLYDQIHKLKKQNYHVTIALDYAWLQSGYYESNYGVDWLSDKAQILFQAGADQIFLPKDIPADKNQKSDVDVMLGHQKRNDLFSIAHVSDNENPLYNATETWLHEVGNPGQKRKYCNDYTIKHNRFIRIQPSKNVFLPNAHDALATNGTDWPELASDVFASTDTSEVPLSITDWLRTIV